MIADWGPDVLFGQVREDAAVEVAALAACEHRRAVVCIGSAGCTALSLLTVQPERGVAIDLNPAQCMLLALKLAALRHTADRAALLEFIDRDARRLYPHLAPPVRAYWQARQRQLRGGLNHCGRVDRRLEGAMRLVRRLVPLPLQPRAEPSWRVSWRVPMATRRSPWVPWRWRAAFALGLSRPVLRLAYGERFVRRLPAGFGGLLREQVEHALRSVPASQNGYVWQTFFGHYPPDAAQALPIYLQNAHLPTVRGSLDRVQIVCAEVARWLEQQPPASIDFFALSNILEIESAACAERLWSAVVRAATPGALVCTRSLFPRPVCEPVTAHGRLAYAAELSGRLGRLDRSPFCRFIQVHRVQACR